MARTIRKIAFISFLSMLAVGCSSGSYSLRETNGNYDYLKTAKLVPLNVPKGLTVPQSSATYVVDTASKLPGNLGAKVDIRPPAEPLALLEHATVNYENNSASVTFQTDKSAVNLWSELSDLLSGMGIKITQNDKSNNTLQTAPYTWLHKDQKIGYTATYSLSLTQTAQQATLQVKLDKLTLQNQPVQSSNEIQRYTTLLLNRVQQGWLALNNTPANAAQTSLATLSLKGAQLQLGKDNNGLPSIIIRQPYQTVWQQLPNVLPNIGFSVESVEKTKGTLVVKFAGLSATQLQQIGVTGLTELTKGSYQLQLGDLTNRTSLQLSDSDGNPVDATMNNDLLNLLKGVLTAPSATTATQ